MVLVGLPAAYSEQARFDREKGYHPIRISFEDKGMNFSKNLLENWPDYRVPIGFSDEEDLDAEGKYNHELYQEANLIEIKSSDSSDTQSAESENDSVSDFEDGPLMDF